MTWEKQINIHVPLGREINVGREPLERQLSRTLPPKEIIHILISC